MRSYTIFFSQILCLLVGASAAAQAPESPHTGMSIGAAGGITSYVGDLRGAVLPRTANDYGYAGSLSYRWNSVWGLEASYRTGYYSTRRLGQTRWHGSSLSLKVALPAGRAMPYTLFGVHRVDAGRETGYGPGVGIGIDWMLTRKVSLFQELSVQTVFPDGVMDQSTDGSSPDHLGFAALGARISVFKRGSSLDLRPIEVSRETQVGKTVRLAVSTRSGETADEYVWELGDGTVRRGRSVEHVYQNSGVYTVKVTVRSGENVTEGQTSLRITDDTIDSHYRTLTRHEPLKILAAVGKRQLPLGQIENFRVQIPEEARRPVEFRWDFGDGTQAEGNNVVHSYGREGLYTVTVYARNDSGRDTLTFRVNAYKPAPDTTNIGRPKGRHVTEPTGQPERSRTVQQRHNGGSELRGSTPIAPSEDGYTWVVATFLSRRPAEQLVRHYRSRMYRTDMIMDGSGSGSTAYRVVIGHFDSRQAALRLRSQLPDDLPTASHLLELAP